MTTPRPRAIGYMRLSMEGPADCWTEIPNQRHELGEEAARRGWDLRIAFDDGHPGTARRRPALEDALHRLDEGEADVLLVGGLDRLTRSLGHFVEILERAQEGGWSVTILRPAIDTSDAAGRFTAHLLASSVRADREFASERTRAGMQRRRDEGAQLGRPRTLPEDVVERIVRDHGDGASLRRIADALTNEGVPTAQGGARWHASTVRAVIEGFKQRGTTMNEERQGRSASIEALKRLDGAVAPHLTRLIGEAIEALGWTTDVACANAPRGYLQLAGLHTCGVLVELSSSVNIDDAPPLTRAEEQELRDLGFNDPEPEDDLPNWWIRVDGEEVAREVAARAAAIGMTLVFGNSEDHVGYALEADLEELPVPPSVARKLRYEEEKRNDVDFDF